MKIIQKGAEANILLNKNKITKDRIPKSYRLPILDNKIRSSRTKKETKLLIKASKLIPIPKVISSDDKENIVLEYIKGSKLSSNLDSLPNNIEICTKIGKQIALLHDAGIIHGDLTTSNMILSSKRGRVGGKTFPNALYFIDFGLGFTSHKIEDKAVDLHLIKQALEAKHFLHYEKFFQAVLEGYKTSSNYQQTLNRLKVVEKRGRYKQAC